MRRSPALIPSQRSGSGSQRRPCGRPTATAPRRVGPGDEVGQRARRRGRLARRRRRRSPRPAPCAGRCPVEPHRRVQSPARRAARPSVWVTARRRGRGTSRRRASRPSGNTRALAVERGSQTHASGTARRRRRGRCDRGGALRVDDDVAGIVRHAAIAQPAYVQTAAATAQWRPSTSTSGRQRPPLAGQPRGEPLGGAHHDGGANLAALVRPDRGDRRTPGAARRCPRPRSLAHLGQTAGQGGGCWIAAQCG